MKATAAIAPSPNSSPHHYSHYCPFISPKAPFLSQFPITTTQCRRHPLNFQNLKPSCPIKPVIGALSSSSSMDSSGPLSTETKPLAVLFVCLGNICRSPAAEGVFRDLVKKRGFESKFNIDSAGTIDYHEGNPADPRMRSAAKRRGVEITSISRPIRPSDFRDFDVILAMDQQNRADILEAFHLWKQREDLPADADKKVKLMCSYCKKHDETEVPDPYYGGPQGFEKQLQILEKQQQQQEASVHEMMTRKLVTHNNSGGAMRSFNGGSNYPGVTSTDHMEIRDEEDISKSVLFAFRAKEEEIEKKKMEIRGRVQAHLGRVEKETKRLAEIREELEALQDPMRKEVAYLRKRVDTVNRELKPLGFTCQKKEREYKEAVEAFNEKNMEKAQLVARLVELVAESEKIRMKKLEELSKNIESLT